MRAMERLEVVENRLQVTDQEYEAAKAAFKVARDAFDDVKSRRYELFSKAFSHIQEQISQVYKDLTRSDAYPLGGQAYLDIEEDTDAPYLSGIKYHAMPPLKRFRDMEHLSGGEKTMAALALLFAIHSYQPSPFFVLDEVDAALDNANVEKIKNYIRTHAGPGMQFIVISLKTGLFQDSESLVGVYRDQEVNSSRTLTLDVSFDRFSWAAAWTQGRYADNWIAAQVRLNGPASEATDRTGTDRLCTRPPGHLWRPGRQACLLRGRVVSGGGRAEGGSGCTISRIRWTVGRIQQRDLYRWIYRAATVLFPSTMLQPCYDLKRVIAP